MEKFETAPQEPQSIEEAIERLLDGDNNATVSFLRHNRNKIGEFCLQLRDRYPENDTTTPFAELARLIDSLL